jgi:hypothetical protein
MALPSLRWLDAVPAQSEDHAGSPCRRALAQSGDGESVGGFREAHEVCVWLAGRRDSGIPTASGRHHPAEAERRWQLDLQGGLEGFGSGVICCWIVAGDGCGGPIVAMNG